MLSTNIFHLAVLTRKKKGRGIFAPAFLFNVRGTNVPISRSITLPISGRRRELSHFCNAWLRRSVASDCSLLTLPDRPTRGFESRLCVSQVSGSVAVAVSQNLVPSRVKLFQDCITSHLHVPPRNSTGVQINIPESPSSSSNL